MTEKEPYSPPNPHAPRNRKVLLIGATTIAVLTLGCIGLLRCQYTSQLEAIHQGNRQFSDLLYAKSNQRAVLAKAYEEDDDSYYETDSLEDEMHLSIPKRQEIRRDTMAALVADVTGAGDDVPVARQTGPGHHTLRGYLNTDDMLLVLEEDDNGNLKGQYYNHVTGKAVSVEGQHKGRKMLLHGTEQKNWEFTLSEYGNGYKGVASDGQYTYQITLR